MREALGPVFASLAQVRRRSILFLFVAALVVWGLITWSYYTTYRSQRAALLAGERGDLRPEILYRLAPGGFSCMGEEPSPTPQEQRCRFIDRLGREFGPTFTIQPPNPDDPANKDPYLEAIKGALPSLLPEFRSQLEQDAARLAPRVVLRDRAETLGTFFGILFVVLIASTLIGAEWRWGVWRTLLTHEPRRGRVLAAKLAALWVAVAVGAIGLLAVTAGLDAVFRMMSNIEASGGPDVAILARVAGRSLLSLELYATVAAALATTIRTSFAGMGSLLFILGDGLASGRFTWLRHFLPTQQIATLLPGHPFNQRPGYTWWPQITGIDRCQVEATGGVNCFTTPLKPIPHWRASVVLVGWIVAFALAAWAMLRARDVPQ